MSRREYNYDDGEEKNNTFTEEQDNTLKNWMLATGQINSSGRRNDDPAMEHEQLAI